MEALVAVVVDSGQGWAQAGWLATCSEEGESPSGRFDFPHSPLVQQQQRMERWRRRMGRWGWAQTQRRREPFDPHDKGHWLRANLPEIGSQFLEDRDGPVLYLTLAFPLLSICII
jgi:hypothetical protein